MQLRIHPCKIMGIRVRSASQVGKLLTNILLAVTISTRFPSIPFCFSYTASVRHLTRPSETCNSDAPYQTRSCSFCVLWVFCPCPPCCLPILSNPVLRRTLENSYWLYCSPVELPDLYPCYLFGIKIYVLCIMSYRMRQLRKQSATVCGSYACNLLAYAPSTLTSCYRMRRIC
jgi:hypothetical protein